MKMLKKVFCILLALLTAFSCCSVALAAEKETYNHYPQILVTGFGSGCVKIYYEDDPEQKSLFWPFETERFITNLGNVSDYVLDSLEDENADVLHSVIYNYLMDCFGMLALNPDGSMMEGVTTEPVGVRYTTDGKYEFYYDCRMSPMYTAKYLHEAVVDVARDFIASLPAVWVCIPDEYFEDAMEFLYGENYNDPDHTYAKLIAEAKYYHYNVANKAAEIYTEAEKNHKGLNMALITKFGIAAIPFGSGENIMDDGLVTVPVSSFGATCVNYGEKLPADYVQQKYPDYDFMCPEWNIDASTGAFPFRTWYIKGLEHTQKNEDYLRLVDEIIYKDLTVFSDPNRPQYLTVSAEDPEMLVPLVAEEKTETLYDKFFGVFMKLAEFARNILAKLWEILGKK